MSKNIYTIAQFHKDFPDDNACLDAFFKLRYGTQTYCRDCMADRKFYRVTGRKCYACTDCGMQIHPLAGTIFHKSSTPLASWFYAMHLFSISKNGVAAKELERHLGVTYKTAHRMARKIRSLMKQNALLGGEGLIVEADETYIGGKRYNRQNWYHKKAIVIGAVQRYGSVNAKVVSGANATTVLPYLRDVVRPGSNIVTDESRIYNRLKRMFPHDVVNHSAKEYVRGDTHTNTIEGFWGQMKRSINGTYHNVSKKYLQLYVDEFVFRYNLRGTDVWPVLLGRAAAPTL